MSYVTTTKVSTAGGPIPAASRPGAAMAIFYTACHSVRTAQRLRLRTTAVMVTAFCLKIIYSLIYPGIYSLGMYAKIQFTGIHTVL